MATLPSRSCKSCFAPTMWIYGYIYPLLAIEAVTETSTRAVDRRLDRRREVSEEQLSIPDISSVSIRL
jgi:hypothetical protein